MEHQMTGAERILEAMGAPEESPLRLVARGMGAVAIREAAGQVASQDGPWGLTEDEYQGWLRGQSDAEDFLYRLADALEQGS